MSEPIIQKGPTVKIHMTCEGCGHLEAYDDQGNGITRLVCFATGKMIEPVGTQRVTPTNCPYMISSCEEVLVAFHQIMHSLTQQQEANSEAV